MVVEYDIPPLWNWLFGAEAGEATRATPSALATFATTVLVMLLLGGVIGYLIAAFRYGPGKGARIVGKTLLQGIIDLAKISPRRVIGLSGLAVREAFRRHVWIVLAIYVLVLMFAGWMLSSDSPEPAKLYLSFVLQATTYLLILVALFLAALSLPIDIKNHTIYTVVTKPVRASEILLGRLIGFTIVGTMLLLVMAVASYVFVSRLVSHEHTLTAEVMLPVREQGEVVAYAGATSEANRHTHQVRLEADAFRPGIAVRTTPEGTAAIITHVTSAAREAGLEIGDRIVAIDGEPIALTDERTPAERIRGAANTSVELTVEPASGDTAKTLDVARTNASVYTDPEQGHTHLVSARVEDGEITYTVGQPEGDLVARVPIYGSLRFINMDGAEKKRGVNVGDVYKYRTYIFGGKREAAIWTFDNLRSEDYPAGLSFDLSLGVYRSHRGNFREGIRGSAVVRNPDTGRQSQEIIFTSQENKLDRIEIPRHLVDAQGNPLELFDDLVTPDGRVEMWIRCVDEGQFFGMARPDVYIRAPDGSYTVNFIKRYVQVWLQMLLVTAIALFCSTFLSGPVAILLTMFIVLLGHYTKYLYHLSQCVIYRDEMTVYDRLRQGGVRLDKMNEAGLERFQMLHDAGREPFVFTSQERLREAHGQGLFEMEILDRVYGGGPLEAAYRIFTQDNLMSDLPREGGFYLMREIDTYLMHIVQSLLNVLPDFERFGTDDYLAHGYNIHSGLIAQQGCATFAFVLAAMVAGYFLLKTREVAR